MTDQVNKLIQKGCGNDPFLTKLRENFAINFDREDYDIVYIPTMTLFVCRVWSEHGHVESVHQLVKLNDDTYIQEGGDEDLHMTFNEKGLWD
jgi:hypothetical protein